MRKVLVIEDDQSFSRLLEHSFKQDINTELDFAFDYMQGLAKAINNQYDLYLIDFHLDHHNGLELIKELSKHRSLENRVIIISSSLSKENQIRAYDFGVSNFLPKPVDLDLLKAIMKKNIRMLNSVTDHLLIYGDLVIVPSKQSLEIKNEQESFQIGISPTEFSILYQLMNSQGRIVTKEDLSFSGRDHHKEMSFKSVEMHISSLRKKIQHLSCVEIKSKWGVGYYLEEFKQIYKAA